MIRVGTAKARWPHSAVADVCQGAMVGLALAGLTFLIASWSRSGRNRLNVRRLKAGPAAFVRALADAPGPRELTIENGRSCASAHRARERSPRAARRSGEEIACRAALSCLDPYAAFWAGRPRATRSGIHPLGAHIRFAASRQNSAGLDSLPSIPGVAAPLAGTVELRPSIRYVERADDATKYGRSSEGRSSSCVSPA